MNFKNRLFAFLLIGILMVSFMPVYAQETQPVVSTEVENELPKLQRLNWSDENYKALVELIERNGKSSPNYDYHKRPYIVVDWDNTSIFSDVQEALFIYQIENMGFKATPSDFAKAIRMDVPKDNFVAEMNNKAGESVNIDLIAQDLDSDYKFLYDNYEGLNGKMSLAEIKETLQYKDFAAKLRYLYDAIGDTFSADISYPWVTYLFAGMTEKDVRDWTRRSNEYHLNHEITKGTLTSPEELPGKAGVVSISYNIGIRTLPEQQNLYKTFIAHGIDVYVCSASFIDVIKEMATNPQFGYGLEEGKILAMELERNDLGVIQPEFRYGYAQTQTKGKTKAIVKYLVSKYGYGPIYTAGDSEGDQNMMEDFEDMQLGLIVNRLKSNQKIGEFSREAAANIGTGNSKYILQGRDENKGVFRNSEATIKYGQTEAKILP